MEQECERVKEAAVSACCFRCNRPAFATLNIEATIGTTQLKLSGDAQPAVVCAACMLELAGWFKIGDQAEIEQAAAALRVCAGGRCERLR